MKKRKIEKGSSDRKQLREYRDKSTLLKGEKQLNNTKGRTENREIRERRKKSTLLKGKKEPRPKK